MNYIILYRRKLNRIRIIGYKEHTVITPFMDSNKETKTLIPIYEYY